MRQVAKVLAVVRRARLSHLAKVLGLAVEFTGSVTLPTALLDDVDVLTRANIH